MAVSIIGDQILNAYIAAFGKEFELEHLERNLLFEQFVNYSIIARLYGGVVDLAAIETGGAFGIDGIAVIANELPVCSAEEIADVSRNSLEARFVFIQSKTSTSIDTGELLKFFQGVSEFFADSPNLPVTEEVARLRELRKEIYKHTIKMDSPPSCDLYYVYPGTWKSEATITGVAANEVSRLQKDHFFQDVNFIPVDLNKLKEYHKSLKGKTVKKFRFERKAVIPKGQGINEAFIGVVSAKEYLTLICDTDGHLESGLFYENVRDYLGDSTPVNREITRTIRDSASRQDSFAFLNNGVTIVARKIIPGGDEVTVHDYQIVNGCQTSHVIFYNKDFLTDSLFLPVKLIATESQELMHHIIRATNSQTEVKEEAFIALEPFHKKLEEYYNSFKLGEQKLYYERRAKQYDSDDSAAKARVVSIASQAKSFIAMHLSEPHSNHRYYGELVKVYWKQNRKLFQDEHDAWPYYLSSYCLFLIDRELRDGRIKPALKPCRYHLLYVIRLLCSDHMKAELIEGSKPTKAYCSQIFSTLSNNDSFEKVLATAIGIIEKGLVQTCGEFGKYEALRRSKFTEQLRELAQSAKVKSSKSSLDVVTTATRTVKKDPRVRGTVKRIGVEFGFVTDDQGQDYWFHRTEVRHDPTWVKIGSKVTFLPAMGVRGWRAIDLELLK